MADAASFAQALQRHQTRIEERCIEFIRDRSLAAVRALVDHSPAQTGRFRSGFRLEVGSPPIGGGELPPDPTGGIAVAAAEQALRSGPPRLVGWHRVYIRNDLPYAGVVDRRHRVMQRALAELASRSS